MFISIAYQFAWHCSNFDVTVSSLELHVSFDDLNQKNLNPKRKKYFPDMWNAEHIFFFFFSGMQPLCVENSRQISTSSSCQNLSEHLESFDFFSLLLLILRRLRGEPEKTFWNGPELAVWLFGNPLLFLSLFYNLIKSALCFATFQALISGLGRVKRPRQFEKGSLHHKEAACSQSFPSSTPPRQKREGESKRVIHWRVIVRT